MKNVLVIRLDAIGDYILFRDCLSTLRASSPYRDARITLLGNEIWKGLAEIYDSDVVDEFIWLNVDAASRSIASIKPLVNHLNSRSFDEVINPVHSRTMLMEIIAANIDCPIKVAPYDDKGNIDAGHKKEAGKFYTELVDTSDRGDFEFHKNKRFIEKITGATMKCERPSFGKQPDYSRENRVCLFVGSSGRQKLWPLEYFLELVKRFTRSFDASCVFLGGPREKSYVDGIMDRISDSYMVENLVGKTTLPGLVGIIRSSLLAITGDTCAVHIACAVGTPVICISNANRLGRFIPYPEKLQASISMVFHPVVENMGIAQAISSGQFKMASRLNMADISPDRVWNDVLNNSAFNSELRTK